MNTPTNSVDSELRSLLFQLSNDSMWCLPGVVGAVTVDREKQARHIDEALQAINNLYIKREDVEEAIGTTDDILRRPTFEQAKTEIAIRDAFRAELRAKLLTPKEINNDTL